MITWVSEGAFGFFGGRDARPQALKQDFYVCQELLSLLSRYEPAHLGLFVSGAGLSIPEPEDSNIP